MDLKKRDELIIQRNDLISLANDIERIIYKQENLVCYGVITEEKAKDDIYKFKEMIKINIDKIKEIEEILLKEYNITLNYSL